MSYAEIMYHWTVRKSDCWSWEDVSPVLEDARYGKWRGPWPAPHTILPLSTIYIEPSSTSLWINHFTIYINHFTIYINHFTIYINHFTIHINHTILPLSTIYIEPSSSSLWINHFTSYINHFTSTIFPYIKSSFFKINRLHFYLSENSSIHSLQMFWVVALIEHADIN